jgi:hypothetical protein
MTAKVIQLQVKPGIQRDGTQFAAPSYVDGRWVRFQAGLPRKIGGYKGIFLNGSGISRGMTMTSVNGLNYVVSGYSLGLEQWQTDNEDGLGFGPVAYSILGGAVTAQLATGGTLYTNGTYTAVPMTGGTGTGAQATVTVADNSVTLVNITAAGSGYSVGDILSASAASIGGTGSGFTALLTANTIFTGGDQALWQFDIGYDTTGGATNNLVAHPGQNLLAIDSTINTRPLYGEFPGANLNPVGIFTETASTTNGSTTITLTSVNARVGAGQSITGSGIPANTTVVAKTGTAVTLSNAATASTSTNLSGVYVTSTTGNFTCNAITGLAITGVVITDTAGQFSCTSTSVPLVIGQTITISGTFGGTGSITGYTNPTTYYIIATNGFTTFQLSTTLGGAGVVTTTGTPTGLTYTAGLATGQIVNITGSTSYSFLSNVYANNQTGNFTYTGSTPLVVGQPITVGGNPINTTLTSVYATSTAGTFACAASTTLTVGQQIAISGTTSNTTLTNVSATTTNGTFSCDNAGFDIQVGQPVVLSGTATNVTINNAFAVDTSGTFVCSATSSKLQVGQSVTISGTVANATLGNVIATSSFGTFNCSSVASGLFAGQQVIVSGTGAGVAITGVIITGTAGQFSCTASTVPLAIGQSITISGTFGGGGSISGYTNPTTYYIRATNGSTSFELSTTPGGAGVVTTAGTPTGLTYTLNNIAGYTNPTTYYITSTDGVSNFTLSATANGAPISTAYTTISGLVFNAVATSITGYTNPKTYFIIETNGFTAFKLSATSGGGAITTTVGGTTNLLFTGLAMAVTGYSNPTTYYVIATLDKRTTFQLSATAGGTAITTTVGPATGFTFVASALSISGYVTPATYYIIATNGSTTFTLSSDYNGSAITTTIGNSNGLTVVAKSPSITGYSNPTTYYVIATDGSSTFQLSSTLGGPPIDNTVGAVYGLGFAINAPAKLTAVAIAGTGGQFTCAAASVQLVVGQPVFISGTLTGAGSITGYVNPKTYYIRTTNGSTSFELSASLGGPAITTTAGTTTGLSFLLNPIGIQGYSTSGSYYIIATNGTTTFQLSATLGGSAITTVIGSTANLAFSVSKPVTLTFDNNISVSGGVVMLHPYLFVYGNNGLIQNSSAGDFNDWTSADANANNVSTGKVVKGLPLRGGTTSPAGLFWSLDSIVRVTYTPSTVNGLNFYWRYDLISSQSSILSSSCPIEYDGIFYWIGTDRFLSYNGVIQEIPNTLNQNYFFENLNYAQRQKVWATKVPRWGEIWWFYPRGNATECNDAIIYNVREKTWYDAGEAVGARRSAGTFSEVFPKPIWAGIEANSTGKYTLWQHESGVDAVLTTTVNAIQSYFETNNLGWVTGGPGNPQLSGENRWLRLERVEPDFVQYGDMNLYVTGNGYAKSEQVITGPYTFTPDTLKIDMREQRRELRLKFESNTFNGNYYMGRVLLSAEMGDERSTGNP